MSYVLTDLISIVLSALVTAGAWFALENAMEESQRYAAVFIFVIVGTFTCFRVVVMFVRIINRIFQGVWIDEL